MKKFLAAVLLFVCGIILFLPPASAQSLKVGSMGHDGDTHDWPLRFLDKIKHLGKGYVEIDRRTASTYASAKSSPAPPRCGAL